jgi:hypothetical protein
MSTLTHTFDVRTGRPLDGEVEAISSLSDSELEREMTIAALASRRADRFEALLAEHRRRSPDARES